MAKNPKSLLSSTTSLRCSKLLIASFALSSTAFTGAKAADYGAGTTTLPSVTVEATRANQDTGYKVDDSSISKFTSPLLDTPKSVTVISRELLDDRNVTTMRDALRNAPGISLSAGEAGAQGDSLTIRGFTARSDFFLDGMRDFGSYYRDPFNLQNVEVLEGPDSILFGRGSTGGVVNQESKTPELYNFNRATLTAGTDNTKRLTADINKQIDATSAFRVNVMGNDSEVTDRDIAENKRIGFAPSLALGIGTATRLNINYYYQKENDVPDYGIPWLFNHPAPVDQNNFYGFADGTNFLRTEANIGTVKLEHDFSDTQTIKEQIRYATYGRDVQITEPQIPAGTTTLTPISSINVNRNQITVSSTETSLDNETDLTSKFKTFGLQHTLVSGMEISRESSDPARTTFTGVPTTSLLDPNPYQSFAGTGTLSSNVSAQANTVAAYTLDTLNLTEKWDLIGGVRYDHVDSEYSQTAGATPAHFSRTDKMASWRGGVVYKPMPNGSIYVDAGTSFNPSIENLSLAANTANVAPEKSKTYEVGTKWDLFEKRLNTSLAIFRDEKTNARVPDPNNALLNILGGDQRVDGFEVKATGHLTEAWQVSAGYTYMDGKVVSTTLANQTGEALANAPRHTFTLWSSYEFTNKVEVGAGANAVSERIASNTPDATTGLLKVAPGYVTFDAMAKYPINEKVNLQLNLYNLTDKYYYDQLHPAHIVPGAGRTALLSANFNF